MSSNFIRAITNRITSHNFPVYQPFLQNCSDKELKRTSIKSMISIFFIIQCICVVQSFSFRPLCLLRPLAITKSDARWIPTQRLESRLGSSTTINSESVVASSPDKPPYAMNIQQNVYLVLTNLFVTCLVVADVIGVKVFNIRLPFPIFGHQNVHHTCGMLSFPITFLISDIINEYYGVDATKKTVYLGLVMSLFVFGIINVAQALPYLDKAFNVTPAAFDMIFGSAKVMYVASICAYLVGQLTDIWLYAAIKRLTKGKLLWLRAAVSTLVSQLLDSFVVSYIAYSFGKVITKQVPATLAEVWNISITGYGLKFFIAAGITPLLYLSRDILQNYFKLEPMPVEGVKAH